MPVQTAAAETEIMMLLNSRSAGVLKRLSIAVSSANMETTAAVKLISFAAESTGRLYFLNLNTFVLAVMML